MSIIISFSPSSDYCCESKSQPKQWIEKQNFYSKRTRLVLIDRSEFFIFAMKFLINSKFLSRLLQQVYLVVKKTVLSFLNRKRDRRESQCSNQLWIFHWKMKKRSDRVSLNIETKGLRWDAVFWQSLDLRSLQSNEIDD